MEREVYDIILLIQRQQGDEWIDLACAQSAELAEKYIRRRLEEMSAYHSVDIISWGKFTDLIGGFIKVRIDGVINNFFATPKKLIIEL